MTSKPFEELTRLGRIRKMRNLAISALKQYGITDAHIKFVRQAGNTMFRIYTSCLSVAQAKDGVFEKDQYLLRIHEVGYQETQGIELELAWLYAMRHEANLPVPEPIMALNGHLLLSINEPGIPKTRNVSLLRWIKGRSIESRVQPHHLQAQGRLMAQMHNFSTNWQAPRGLTKRRFDWDGLFKNDVGSGMTNAEAMGLLSPLNKKAFSFVAERIREVMQDWGEGPDVFGLIHGDLGVDANLLFWQDEPRPIDFDDSGYGYWVFDLAVALEAFRDDSMYSIFKSALLDGYREIRTLPEKQADQIDLFLVATEVYWNLWATGGTHLHPQYLPGLEERMNETTNFVVRYAQKESLFPQKI